jgi:hypothetical protein
MDARPKILAAKLFPLKDIRASQMEEALRTLTSAELVSTYEVDGKPFLQMKTWNRHQQIRAKKSKYPAPDGSFNTEDNACDQMISDDCKCPRNPIQSESNPNQNQESNTRAHTREDEADELFQSFWDAYPRKTGDIREAYFEYQHAVENVEPQMLVDCAIKYAQTLGRNEARFAPSADKWLRNQGWKEVKNGQSVSANPQNGASTKRYNIHYDVDGS